MNERRFPIQRGGSIPWWLAEIAWAAYEKAFGSSQSMERMAERGGFSRLELIRLLRLGHLDSGQIADGSFREPTAEERAEVGQAEAA